MAKQFEVLAGGIVRDFRFRDQTELEVFLYKLKHREEEYKVLETCPKKDGTVLARIVQEYKMLRLIELYND